jgi:hypothetical protein
LTFQLIVVALLALIAVELWAIIDRLSGGE